MAGPPPKLPGVNGPCGVWGTIVCKSATGSPGSSLAAFLSLIVGVGGSEFVAGVSRHNLAAKGSNYRSLVWKAQPNRRASAAILLA